MDFIIIMGILFVIVFFIAISDYYKDWILRFIEWMTPQKRKIFVFACLITFCFAAFLAYRETSFNRVLRAIYPRNIRIVNTSTIRDGYHERFGIRYRIALVDYEYSFTYWNSDGERATHHATNTKLVHLESNHWGIWQQEGTNWFRIDADSGGALLSFLTFPSFQRNFAFHNYVIIPTDGCVIDFDNLPPRVTKDLRDDLNENEMILWIETTILSGENSFSVRIIFEEHDGVEMIFARSANNDAINLLRDLFIRC